ncbi:hypothetical protein JBKA6_1345 [Ichthyobacterium seriolicida]|uniref:LPS export ABC transporter periplasmic protein LptC n=1 Tax=Ichthyobacterium seriolicida TaxID=242600 RepID=A0A1J1E7P6_9FLAO|nr:hypothetical protein JBKA6_1345 [Ichthyobacterium seriolicida]
MSCENNIEEIDKIIDISEMRTNYAKSLNLVYTDSGRVKVRFKTPEVIAFDKKEEPYREFPKGIEVSVFNDEVEGAANFIKSNYAKEYTTKGFLELKSNVIIINSKGDTIYTEELFWDRVTKKIYSEDLVKISSKNETLIGKNGFEAPDDMSTYNLKGISGDINME